MSGLGQGLVLRPFGGEAAESRSSSNQFCLLIWSLLTEPPPATDLFTLLICVANGPLEVEADIILDCIWWLW
jgi:hypothetical protein